MNPNAWDWFDGDPADYLDDVDDPRDPQADGWEPPELAPDLRPYPALHTGELILVGAAYLKGADSGKIRVSFTYLRTKDWVVPADLADAGADE